MARIKLTGLEFHGYHGVLAEEQRLGQRFIIDVTLEVDVSSAVRNDDYELAVCYAAVSTCVGQIVTGAPLRLIEALADRIAMALLAQFARIDVVTVRVSKPSAPIPHVFKNVSAQVKRARWRRVGFSLGSNLGARADHLREAIAALRLQKGVRLQAESRVYETAPWGDVNQSRFLNCCVVGQTRLAPLNLLRRCKKIEQSLGREPGRHWGPRRVDIDILFIDDIEVESPALTLPHAQMTQRAFVLEPLAEIAADVKIAGKTVRQLLKDVPRYEDDICLWSPTEEIK